MSVATGFMTNTVMNSANPVVTSAGGRSCIDIARFRKDSTMTMRVKHVIVMTSAGAIDSAVISSTISIAVPTVRRSSPALRVSVTPGACATAGAATGAGAAEDDTVVGGGGGPKGAAGWLPGDCA